MNLQKILKFVFFSLLIISVGLFSYIFLGRYLDSSKVSADVPTLLPSQTPGRDFKWGVGVNLYSLAPLSADKITDWTISKQQIDQAKSMGATYIRVGIPDWAMKRQDELILPALQYAHSIGLNVVLGFDPIEGNPVKLGSDDRYANGYKWGNDIANRYKGLVNYYQLSNEVTGTAMKPDWPGIDSNSFDPEKYKQVLNWLKGASTGIKQVDPSAKKVVTGHWLGFGFFQMAIKDGLEFDVIGWDWYGKDPSIDKIKSGKQTYNISDELAKFGKELWITETNYEAGSRDGEDKQADYIAQFAKKIYKDKRFSGFFPLMLSDIATTSDVKNHDGLVNAKTLVDGTFGLGQPKQAYYDYQKLITQSK